MKKRIIILIISIAVFFSLIITFFVTDYIFGFFGGSPLTRLSNQNKIETYLSNKYPNEKFRVKKVYQNFFSGRYDAKVSVLNGKNELFDFSVQMNRSEILDRFINASLCRDLKPTISSIYENSKSKSIKITGVYVEAMTDLKKYNIDETNYNSYSAATQNIPIQISVYFKGDNNNKEEYGKCLYNSIQDINKLNLNISRIISQYISIENNDLLYEIPIEDNFNCSEKEILSQIKLR